MLMWAILAVILLAWIYILFVREAMVAIWPDKFRWWHENVEDKIWAQSRTLFIARLYWVGAILVSAHEALAAGGYDFTPLLKQISQFVPEEYRPIIVPAFLLLTGAAMEYLRRRTTSPLHGSEPVPKGERDTPLPNKAS